MVRDIDAEDYVEQHSEGRLEYRFAPHKGIPFPAFAAASSEFPELRVQAEWRDAERGLRGHAVIENGRLVEQENVPLEDDSRGVAIEAGPDAELRLAVACVREGARWLGYVVSAARHAYFVLDDASNELLVADAAGERWTARLHGGRSEPVDAPIEDALLEALERIAFRFAGEWLWYDEEPEEQTAAERERYAARGWPVRGANLKAGRVASLGAEGRFGQLPPQAARLPALLRAAWLSSP